MTNALLALIILLPTYLIRFELHSVPFTLLEVVVIMVVAGWIVKLFALNIGDRNDYLAHLKTVPRLYLVGMAAIFLGATIGLFFSPNLTSALGIWKAYIVEPMMIALIFFLEMRSRKQIQYVGHALVTVGGMLSCIGILQYVTHVGLVSPWDGITEPIRATSLYPYPNALALVLAPIASYAALALLFGAYGTARKKQIQIAYGVSLVLMVTALLLTASEGGFAGFAVAFGIMSLFHKKRWRIFGAGMAIAVASLAIPRIREIVAAIFSLTDVSTDVRLVLWQGTLRLLAAHPLVGAGLGGFPNMYAMYKEAKHVELLLYPHNIFLNFWAETGIIGLAGLILTLLFMITGLFRAKRDGLLLAFFGAMLAVFLHGLVDVPFFKNDLAIVWWIIVTSICVLFGLPRATPKIDKT